MDNQQVGILAIIKSALTGEPCSLPEGFDIEAAAEVANKHQIVALFYYGALNCGVSSKLPIMQKLFVKTCQLASLSEQQMYAINELMARFDAEKIDYMPLKGTNLKKLYPQSEMRIMSDADILIRTGQYDRIKPVMLELGFDEDVESDHELIWNKRNAHIELHKRLIPSYNKDYYAYFGDGWQLGKPVSDGVTRYVMSPEDEMIYLFTHYAKHYRDAGIGLKHIVDLWVYNRSIKNLDNDYIYAELKKLKLYEFYKNTMRTLAVFFDGAEEDEVTKIIANTIFDSGAYGTHEASVISTVVKISKNTNNGESARRRRMLNIIFPPYSKMRKKYTILEKAPILLPIMWIVRCINALLFKRDVIKDNSDDFKTMSADKIESYQQALNFVGLDFNFEE